MSLVVNNEMETYSFAESLKENITDNSIFLLSGDLGSGKTTFVKGVVRALAGDTNEVSSPTYVYCQQYDIKDSKLLHLDLYRIKKGGFDQDLVSLLEDNDCPVFIEWPENISDKLLIEIKKNYKVVELIFEIININSRKITIRR